jgi:hypothetical protein
MARKYEAIPGFYCWNLEKCEEEIVIAALGEISGLIPLGQKWRWTLQDYFFERGKGFADEALSGINRIRADHDLEPVQIRETAVGDYALSRDELMKSQRRHQIREELREASADVWAERLAQAKVEEAHLPPAHYTYEDFKLRKLQQNAALPLGQEDRAKTPSAWRAGGAPEVIPIGPRLLPVSKKHANFQRLFPSRIENVLEAIRKLTNLSSPNYAIEEADLEEVDENLDTCLERLEQARARFRRRLANQSRSAS